MENASKALIMAASVLLGLMIISVGVALFNTFSEFSRDTLSKVEEKSIAEFNNNYIKYYGNISSGKDGQEVIKPIPVTAHDIVSVANLAKQNNEKYELENQSSYDENTYYVQVQVEKETNFEKKTEKQKSAFLQENSLTEENETKYYKCAEVKISEVTKRVMYIKFVEYEK